jgi:hypothetical protein
LHFSILFISQVVSEEPDYAPPGPIPSSVRWADIALLAIPNAANATDVSAGELADPSLFLDVPGASWTSEDPSELPLQEHGSVLFMRYVQAWLLRMIRPELNSHGKNIELPLPNEALIHSDHGELWGKTKRNEMMEGNHVSNAVSAASVSSPVFFNSRSAFRLKIRFSVRAPLFSP